ncbi:hypothetical protein EYF80_029042 [Liparis tanakae]|uniref:Uncharacterized protein n=1 Tax=Liparis tanakae TaxID=230148 RepID=A0A4Z2H4C3_9TELE|nr:hypothetical protein EYF80_029042 [Liparis tanakae]
MEGGGGGGGGVGWDKVVVVVGLRDSQALTVCSGDEAFTVTRRLCAAAQAMVGCHLHLVVKTRRARQDFGGPERIPSPPNASTVTPRSSQCGAPAWRRRRPRRLSVRWAPCGGQEANATCVSSQARVQDSSVRTRGAAAGRAELGAGGVDEAGLRGRSVAATSVRLCCS